jgi:uncharacterized membrane protein
MYDLSLKTSLILFEGRTDLLETAPFLGWHITSFASDLTFWRNNVRVFTLG